MSAKRYVLEMPGEGCEPSAAALDAALAAAGWVRWDGTGLPDAAVLHNGSNKGDYFEAGFWAGRGVPLFFLGGGSRAYSRKLIATQFGGWSVVGRDNRCTPADLLDAIARRFPAAVAGR